VFGKCRIRISVLERLKMYTVRCILYYVYNEQTNAHLIDSLRVLYCSLFIAATLFNANAPSSRKSYSVPVEFHKRVHTFVVVFFIIHIVKGCTVQRLYDMI
jgi:hypothetical protein